MEIKVSSVLLAIVALFLVKISLEATIDQSKKTTNPIDRTPASNDQGYESYVKGKYQTGHSKE